MDVHTHTHTHTHTHLHSRRKHRDICNQVLEGKKTRQKVYTSTKNEEKLQKVLIVGSFEGAQKRKSAVRSNTSSLVAVFA